MKRGGRSEGGERGESTEEGRGDKSWMKETKQGRKREREREESTRPSARFLANREREEADRWAGNLAGGRAGRLAAAIKGTAGGQGGGASLKVAEGGEERDGQVGRLAARVADGELHERGGGVGREGVLRGEEERDHVRRRVGVGQLGGAEAGEEGGEEDEEDRLGRGGRREDLDRDGDPEADSDAGRVGARGGVADELEDGRVGGAGGGEHRLGERGASGLAGAQELPPPGGLEEVDEPHELRRGVVR